MGWAAGPLGVHSFYVSNDDPRRAARWAGSCSSGWAPPPAADTTCNPASNGRTLRADPIVRLADPAIGPFLQGPVRPPEPNEAGWKDTVIMLPGEVTRILARYAPQARASSSRSTP